MPHLFIQGTDMDKQIEYINVHIDLNMKPSLYYDHLRRDVKLKELTDKISDVLLEYFEDVEVSDLVSNHEYNLNIRK